MNPSTIIKNHQDDKIGKAVYAQRAIVREEVVIASQLVEIIPQRNKYSLQLGENHILIDEPGIFVNHSCEPNCILVENQYGAFDFIACRPISCREEITFDYESIESEITSFQQCHCGSAKCRGFMKNKNNN